MLVAMVLVLSSAAPTASHAAQQGCVPGPHSGMIAASQEWCLKDSPHLVTGNVSVASGATLTVESGVEIRFSGGVLDVLNGGALVAQGAPTQPITFTVTTAGSYWAGIAAESGSRLRLAYCDVGYAGSDASHRSISVDAGADAQVRHCRIHDMDPHEWSTGLVLRGSGLTGVFEDLEIDHNSNAVSQDTVNMNPTYINLRLHDNGVNAVAIAAAYLGTPLNQDVRLDGSPAALNGAPIHLSSTIIGPSRTLTVTAGTTLKMATGALLSLTGGTLIAEGTPTLPITFTALTTSWAGIAAESGSRLRLSYCDVGYAGSDYVHRSISVDAGADAQVRHCRIHDMDPHEWSTGLVLRGSGLTGVFTGVFEDLEIDHNSNAVSQDTVNMNPTYINLRLHDNGVNAVAIAAAYLGTPLNQDVRLDGSPAALNGAPIHLSSTIIGASRTLTVTAGTTLKMAPGALLSLTGGTLIAEGTPTQPITFTALTTNWAGIAGGSGSTLRLSYCDVGYAGSDYVHRGISVDAGADAQVRNCRIHHTSGRGLLVNGGQIAVRNLALVDNTWEGLSVQSGARANGLHLTLARNDIGVRIESGGTVTLTNSILAGNATGVRVGSGGAATLSHTLWDSNTTPVVGTVSETGHLDGPAAFDADGYHILAESEAVQRGVNVGVTDDIDGEARPSPAGTAPDLGADENPTLRRFYIYLPLVLRPSP